MLILAQGLRDLGQRPPEGNILCFKEGQNRNFEKMRIEKQVNKNDSDSSNMIFKRKICIHLARRIKLSQCY